ncbi:hypothetical protein [Deinococcus hopiensis]|uniref:Uncharacterized protein n=1 Tax=Deinococcus hopiensis KR-140 TaxID=695939 RepID=A0A1W1U9R1_9DEIO|nr:hypothetical protein [Deinococcus hopiensis]SMB77826.1 hypothetical protein SAMN00790413_03946 [Deinococcus hopiensis KR-140]
MSRLEKLQRRLEAIEELEKNATPSERVFLQETRARYERAALTSAQSGPQEQNAEALARSLDQGIHGLHSLNYQLSKPDLDPYWVTYLQDQVKRYEVGIQHLREQLDALGHVYVPPIPDEPKMQAEEEREGVEERLRERETLLELTQAWAERHGTDAQVAGDLKRLAEEIEGLRARL